MADSDVITVLSSDEESPSPPKRMKPIYLGSVSITPVKKDLCKEEEKEYLKDIVVISDDINTANLKNISITEVKKLKKDKSKREDVVVLSDEDVEILEKVEKDLQEPASTQEKKMENNKTDDQDIINEESNDEDCEIISESDSEKSCSKEKTITNQEQALIEEKETKNNHVADQGRVNEESNDEDCEIISQSGSEKSSSKENVKKSSSSEEYEIETNPPKNIEIEESSTKSEPIKNFPHNSLLEIFLQACENSVKDTRYVEILKKFSILRKFYKKCDSDLVQSQSFQKILEENTKRAEKSATKAVISFKEVYQHTKDVVEAKSIEVSEERRLKLKKLEKTIRALLKRIRRLEEMEVDFDEEEDSTFIQLSRYTDRLNKVNKKYCELMNKNPYSGRLTYAKLDFADSEFNEINRAISKKYKNRNFPSYVEMQNFIKKVVEDNNLPLSEAKIKSESIHCFKKLGELMQKRRKMELYDSHYMYIRDGEDPADKDTSLCSTLRESHKEGVIKIEKVCQEYATKEELGEEANADEEGSDNSDYVDSENEDIISPDKKDTVDKTHTDECIEPTEQNKHDQD